MTRRAFFLLALVSGLFGLALGVDASRRGLMMQTPVASGGSVSYQWQTNRTSTTDSSSYSFTSVPIGTASSDRYVWVFAAGKRTPASFDVSSVTINGVSGTAAVAYTNSDGGAIQAGAWYYANVPTGTSVTVDVGFTSTSLRCGISVYSMTGFGSVYATDRTNSTLSVLTNIVPTATGGVVLAGCMNGLTGADQFTWSVVHEDADITFGAESQALSTASTNIVSGGTMTLYPTIVSPSIPVLMSVSISP